MSPNYGLIVWCTICIQFSSALVKVTEDVTIIINQESEEFSITKYTLANSNGVKLQLADKYEYNVFPVSYPDDDDSTEFNYIGFNNIKGYVKFPNPQFKAVLSWFGEVLDRKEFNRNHRMYINVTKVVKEYTEDGYEGYVLVELKEDNTITLEYKAYSDDVLYLYASFDIFKMVRFFAILRFLSNDTLRHKFILWLKSY